MTTDRSAFWDDLDKDLEDAEFKRHFLLESERIATIDRIINELDSIRSDLGLSKADLARAIEKTPEAVRRLLTAKSVNPQFSIVVEMATALGYRFTLEPMSTSAERAVAQPVRTVRGGSAKRSRVA